MEALPAPLLARMLEVQAAIVAETSLARIMQVLTDAALELRGATGAVIELAEGEDMVYRAASGSAAASLGMRLKIAGSFSGLCVRTGETLICEDAETDDRVDRVATRKVGVRSMIVVPLRRAEQTVGAFKLLSDRPRAFAQRDAQLLLLMAGFVANAMHNAVALERAESSALHDPLTGLANRTLLHDRLRRALKRLRRQEGALAVMFIDLDGFKPVNDRYGHAAGDALLCEVGARLVRASRDTDTVARVGGDEFAVLAAELAAPDHAAPVAERIRHALEEPYRLDQGEVVIGASLGLRCATGKDAAEAERLIAEADAAMYADKRRRVSARKTG